MNDPVSDLLERRLATPWRWRSAVILALTLHAGVAALALFGPAPRGRALTLPRVQVRITSAPALQPAASASATQAAAPKSVSAPPKAAVKPGKPASKPSSRKPVTRSAKPAPTAAPTVAATGEGDGGSSSQSGSESAQVVSPAGSIGLGRGTGGTDEVFPYGYYLNRVLATIEGNWFRPPADVDVRCRVLCRVDRGGGLVQVGIEEPSGVPAFDRAALRSVYASVPFPPLPQGYSGSTLTLHLEFGSK